MTTTHSPRYVYAGDQWEIPFRLFDRNDHDRLDITGAELLWLLIDSTGVTVITSGNTLVNVTVTNAVNGEFTISVPPTLTTALDAGAYTDVLRISSTAIGTETLCTGTFNVRADPFVDQPRYARVWFEAETEFHAFV